MRHAIQFSCRFLAVSCIVNSVAVAALPFIVVLGIAQDAGYPQAGCDRNCCREAWSDPAKRRSAASLAVVDPESHERWLFDCTPDFRPQLRLLDGATDRASSADPSLPKLTGIFLTHAHIGHYTGLMHLGREVIGARGVSVYAMPRMSQFLRENGPWSQLVNLENIRLRPLAADQRVQVNSRISVTPILVPHRDEFSETVGFVIAGPEKKALYIPDIDKWERWDRSIETYIRGVDVAWVDGTFFDDDELPGRDMSQIPHPFIRESLHRLGRLPRAIRQRVRFIHLNHTNPALREDSAAQRLIRDAGFHIASQGEIFQL